MVSRNDPGVAYVDSNARLQMDGLRGLAGFFQRFDLDGADHTFTPDQRRRSASASC